MISQATVNPVMTGYAVQFMRNPAGFVGNLLFPAFACADQSADYYVWKKENSLNIPADITRSPGAPVKRSLPLLGSDTYSCKNYGHATPVPDEIRKKYANKIDADISAIRRNTEIIKVHHEKRAKALATGGSVPTSGVGLTWLDDDSKPKDDVDAAKEEIRLNSGQRPNLMVISEATRLRLATHPVIAERIKYTTTGVTSLQLLAAYFEIDRIAVAEQVENTAAEGQTITPADIWGTDVIIAHVNAAQDLLVPTFGRTFYWNQFGSVQEGIPMAVDSYRDEDALSDIHRTHHFTDEKLVYPEAGYRLSGALAAVTP